MMQVTETKSEGLKREFQVVLPADELETRLATELDVRDLAGVRAWAAATRAAFGRIDVLINNAGILLFKTLLETTKEDYLRVLQVNLMGMFLGLKAVAPHMIERGSGVPSSMPRRVESEPAATLRHTTSSGMISTSRTSCSRMLRRRIRWVGMPISSSRIIRYSEMRLLSTPLPVITPFFLALKAVASSLNSTATRSL